MGEHFLHPSLCRVVVDIDETDGSLGRKRVRRLVRLARSIGCLGRPLIFLIILLLWFARPLRLGSSGVGARRSRRRTRLGRGHFRFCQLFRCCGRRGGGRRWRPATAVHFGFASSGCGAARSRRRRGLLSKRLAELLTTRRKLAPVVGQENISSLVPALVNHSDGRTGPEHRQQKQDRNFNHDLHPWEGSPRGLCCRENNYSLYPV